MKVTSRLASQFIEENLKYREQFVEGASEFLEQELAKSKGGLEAQEQIISDYKRRYMGGAAADGGESCARSIDCRTS